MEEIFEAQKERYDLLVVAVMCMIFHGPFEDYILFIKEIYGC